MREAPKVRKRSREGERDSVIVDVGTSPHCCWQLSLKAVASRQQGRPLNTLNLTFRWICLEISAALLRKSKIQILEAH